MTSDRSAVFLLDVANDIAVDAEICDGITEQQLVDWEAGWVPELHGALRRLRDANVARQYWPQSRHWDWRKKTLTLQKFLTAQGFSVTCRGMTEGMMVVDSAMHRCRAHEQLGQHLVYVDYLETAPWNRKELLFDPPRYRGVGSILMRAAVELSLQEGFKGRIALHSLPQAHDWYAKKCGMTTLGVDPNKENLHYFEMTSAQADAFIGTGNVT